MTRRAGAVLGRVSVYEPTAAKPHYRLAYTDLAGRRHQLSGSADPVAALAKADALNASLTTAAPAPGGPTLGQLVADYTSTRYGRKRSKSGRLLDEDWSPAHYKGVRQDLRRAVAGLEDIPAAALDRATVDHMRSACGTPGMVDQLTATVRSFLYWAEEAGAISAEQAELLPVGGRRTVRPRLAQPERRPRRRQQVRAQGRDQQYVSEEDAPAQSQVCALGHAMAAERPWGELATHTAAGAGLRAGEQFQLTADNLQYDAEDDQWYWVIDWQWCSEKSRRTRPKGNKTRRVPVAKGTATGYRLESETLARAEQARAERAAGTNVEALMFPSPEGKIYHPGALSEMVVRAQKAAGWKYVMVNKTRTLRNGERKVVLVTQMDQPWHSLRHRFARDQIAAGMGIDELMAIGGWENIETLSARYFRTGDEHVRRAAASMRAASRARQQPADIERR